MKTSKLMTLTPAGLMAKMLVTTASAKPPRTKMTTPLPEKITTPDDVKPSIGALIFFDEVPIKDTVQTIYDYAAPACAVEVFPNTTPAVSMYQLREGQRGIAAKEIHKIHVFSDLLDSKSLALSANTPTLYAWAFLNLKKDGPIAIELPPRRDRSGTVGCQLRPM